VDPETRATSAPAAQARARAWTGSLEAIQAPQYFTAQSSPMPMVSVFAELPATGTSGAPVVGPLSTHRAAVKQPRPLKIFRLPNGGVRYKIYVTLRQWGVYHLIRR